MNESCIIQGFVLHVQDHDTQTAAQRFAHLDVIIIRDRVFPKMESTLAIQRPCIIVP